MTSKKNNTKAKRRTLRRNAVTNTANTGYVPQIVRYQPSVYGFPDRLMTKLRYCDYHNLTCTSGALASIVYRWNSCFDPYQSGAGHQPLYFDTYNAVYDQYAVVSARAKITVVNPHATVSGLIGSVTDDDTSLSSTFQTLMEQSHGQSTLVSPLSGSASEVSFVKTWSAKEVLGIDPYTSETYKTGVGSDPTEVSTLAYWAIPSDGSSSITFQTRIEIVFDVLFTELKTPTQS